MSPNLHASHSCCWPVLRAGLALALLKLGVAAAQVVVPISGLSPNPDGGDPGDAAAVTRCNGAPQTGVVYRNSESEPHLAVNPLDRDNLIAGWHQDRWSTGGAQSLGAAYSRDGGQTWTRVVIPFTRCAGALPGSGGDYERASDPWISFGPTGTAYFMALSIDRSSNENAMLVSRSTDKGASWSAPTAIIRQPAQDAVLASVSHDKNSLLADPYDARRVYAAWTVFRTGVTSLVFSRSTDGGKSWSPPAPIATMGSVARSHLAVFRQGAQMAVLPDGTLVDAFFRIVVDQRTGARGYEQALLRSADQGRRWSRVDTPVSPFGNVTARDLELGIPVRDAEGLPSVAVVRSTDGGLTWSTPVRANPAADNRVQAFLPTVAVNDDGTVGVLFYDFRNDVSGDAPLSTDVHLSLFDAALNFVSEKRLTPTSFDLRQMVLTGARGFFPGDYVGLSSTGTDFVAAFTRSNPLGLPVLFPQNNDGVFVDASDRQSIVFVRQSP